MEASPISSPLSLSPPRKLCQTPKPSRSSSTSEHLTPHSEWRKVKVHSHLHEEICKNTLEISPFFSLVSQLKLRQKKEPVLAPILKNVKFPEDLCIPETPNSLSDYNIDNLNAHNPLFSSINKVISELDEMKKQASPETTQLLDQLIKIYAKYIEDVCESLAPEREKLLIGKARLYIDDKCYLLEQRTARKITCIDHFGKTKCNNAFGAGAVSRLGKAFFKRPRGLNPLMPGQEFAVFTLDKLLCKSSGITATQMIKVDNLWVDTINHNEFSSLTELNTCYKTLSTKACYDTNTKEGFLNGENRPGAIFKEVIKTVKESNPDIKIPYLHKRIQHNMLSSYGVDGENLKQALEKGTNFEIQNFTQQIIRVMITLLSDGRSDNLMITPVGDKYWVIGIDNDGILGQGAKFYSGTHSNEVKFSLFLLSQMKNSLDPEYVKEFLKLIPEDLFLIWLSRLEKKEKNDNELLALGIYTKQEFEELWLPLKLTPAAIYAAYQRLKLIHTTIKNNPTITGWKLFKTVMPPIAAIYESLLVKTDFNVLEAEAWLFDRRNRMILLQEWLDSSQCSKEGLALLCWEDNDQPLEKSIQKCFEEIPSSLTVDEQIAWLKMIFRYFPDRKELTLKSFQLTDDQLFLSSRKIKVLSLDNCAYITEKSLLGILENQAKIHLKIANCPAISKEGIVELYTCCQKKGHSLSLIINGKEILLEPALLQNNLIFFLENDLLDYAKVCLQLGAKLKEDVVGPEGTLLHKLAEKNCPLAVDYLLENGLEVDAKNRFKQTPLHLAAQAGHIKNVELLLGKQAEVDSEDNSKHTPIFLAAFRGHLDVFQLLLKNDANYFIRDVEKATILHVAAYYGHLGIIQEILKQPIIIQLINAQDDDGKTPLHKAVCGNFDSEIIRTLINAKAFVNAENNFGYLPIHFAAKEGRDESVKALLNGGSFTDRPNQNGDLPIDLAIRHGRDNVAFFLLTGKELTQVPNVLSEDMEGYYHKCLNHAKNAQDIMEEVFYLGKISDIHLDKKQFVKAAVLVNRALLLAQGMGHSSFVQYLLTRLERIEGFFLDSFGIKTSASFRNYVQGHRNLCKQSRLDTVNSLSKGEPPQKVAHKYFQSIKELLSLFVKESISIDLMGNPPCEYAFVCETAKQEMALGSKLAFKVLLPNNEKENTRYFGRLNQLLELKFMNAGMPLNIVIGANLLTIPGDLDLSHGIYLIEGSKNLLKTHKKLIEKSSKENDRAIKDKLLRSIATHLRAYKLNTSPCYPIEDIINDLACWFNIDKENSFDQIEALFKKKILFKELYSQLKEILEERIEANFSSAERNNLKDLSKFFETMQAFYTARFNELNNISLRDDPTVAGGYYLTANALIQVGLHAEALDYYLKDLAASELSLGKEHPGLIAIYEGISKCYEIAQDYDSAIKFNNEKLNLQKKLFGKNSPELEKTYCDLIAVYTQLKKFDKVLQNYTEILEIKKGTHHIHHPNLQPIYDVWFANMAVTSLKKALEMHGKSHNITLQKFGEDHPETLQSLLKFCQIHQFYGSYEDGLKEAKKVFCIAAPIDLEVALIALEIVFTCHEKSPSEESLNEIKPLAIKIFGEDHPIMKKFQKKEL